MKKLLLVGGLSLIFLNIITGLIFSGYDTFNNILVNVSILSSISVTYFLYSKTNADAFRIVLTFGYSFSGLIKIGLSFFSKNTFENNLLVLALIVIIVFELLTLLLIQYMSKHVT